MSAPRRGLGRGLGALIPTGPALEQDVPEFEVLRHQRIDSSNGASIEPPADRSTGPGYFAEIPVDRIVPNPRQPRQVFDDDALDELVRSIGQVGLLQPVVVRRVGEQSYELVMGERRWRASRRAGLELVPAIVRATEDNAMLRDALLENLHRAELNPLEEAAAYGQLLDDFGCTHDELAERIGRSRPHISNTLRLLKLPPPVQRRVAAGVLSAGHARALLGIDDSEAADRLAHRVVAEGISVRALEEIVAVGEPDAARSPQSAARARASSTDTGEAADRLADLLDTRVRIDLGRNRGRILIDVGSAEDLDRIVGIITGQRPTHEPSAQD